jgi:NADH-quinone oxidoreductase subunit L
MSDLAPYLWLIPGLPLAASAITALIAFFGSPGLRRQAHWPCILAVLGSCVCAIAVLVAVAAKAARAEQSRAAAAERAEEPGGVDLYQVFYPPGTTHTFYAEYTWFRVATVDVRFTFRVDPLTAVMLVTVTFIGSLIVIYSVGYMHGDDGYPRFFAEVALFIFSMTLLVLADNFLLLYAGWEGVGLCSYLLIGFWYQKPSAAAAARKAFLVTRLGDTGLLLGILVLWYGSGYRLDYDGVFAHASPAIVTTACLLLFCGAVGKSAQFPLHVWLPDAMEGPTPVSALIHAATMVTAGVYLVARCTPLFVQAPAAQLTVAVIGGFTALLAALIALTQTDLKRVLAYSTVSQLGYMFLALGSATGGPDAPLVTFAVVAAIFHLFTHAFFKALLFLSAGSVMHAMGGVIDMRRFSGLRQVLPITHLTFLCGAGALAAVPPLAGFWSKDEILGAAFAASGEGHPYRAVYALLFIAGLVTAGLTAFYTARAYVLTFLGELKVPPEAGHHAHESPRVMTTPLVILALGALGAGLAVGPTGWLEHLLAYTRGLKPGGEVAHTWVIPVGGIAFALGGIVVAWWMYIRLPGLAGRLAAAVSGLYQWSLNKFYLDELYDFFFVKPMEGFAEFCRIFDLHLLDGVVDLVAQTPRGLAKLFRPMQNGLVQFYALAMILGLAVVLVSLVVRSLNLTP